MKENKIRQMLRDGKVTTSTRVWSTWPFYTEAIGETGNFSYVEFVGEYAPFTQLDLENICRAAELHDMGSMMKVDFQGRKYIAQKAVAAGFQAILFADHHTADEVRDFSLGDEFKKLRELWADDGAKMAEIIRDL